MNAPSGAGPEPAGAGVGILSRIARPLRREAMMPAYVAMWMTGRSRPARNEFGYRRHLVLGQFLIVALVTAPVELLLIELLVPWAWLRWLLLVLAIYATLWLVGLYASYLVLPHKLEGDAVLLRHGMLASVPVPYRAIVAAAIEPATAARDGAHLSEDGSIAWLAVGRSTQVVLRLGEAVAIQGYARPFPPVRTIRFAVDEAETFLAALRERIPPRDAIATAPPPDHH